MHFLMNSTPRLAQTSQAFLHKLENISNFKFSQERKGQIKNLELIPTS